MHSPNFILLRGTATIQAGFKNACQMGFLFDEIHLTNNESMAEADELLCKYNIDYQ